MDEEKYRWTISDSVVGATCVAPAIAVFRRWGSLEFYDIRLRKLAVVLYNITICKNYKDTVSTEMCWLGIRRISAMDIGLRRRVPDWGLSCRILVKATYGHVYRSTPLYKKKKTKQRPKMIFSLRFAHVSSIFHSFLKCFHRSLSLIKKGSKRIYIACSRVPVLTRKFLE